MKYILAFAFFAAANLIASAAQPEIPTINTKMYRLLPTVDERVTLRAGTLVLLETNEKIFSNDVTVGKTLMFRVRTNVMAEGEVAVTTGALAIGRVKSIQMSSYNVPEEIRIELQYVQSVDGQQIPLNGNEQSIKAQFTGEGAPVETGLSITAQVMNDIEIKVK